MLIPRPLETVDAEGELVLDRATTLSAPEELGGVLAWFQQALRPATGLALRESSSGTVVLRLDPDLGEEAYRLEVTEQGAVISGGAPAGVFYGCQSFLQLLPPAVYRKGLVAGQRWAIKAVTLTDAPRFGWRGVMLDVARHFLPKHDVLRFIDLMAVHRLNTLHWHLTEDQAGGSRSSATRSSPRWAPGDLRARSAPVRTHPRTGARTAVSTPRTTCARSSRTRPSGSSPSSRRSKLLGTFRRPWPPTPSWASTRSLWTCGPAGASMPTC